MSYSSAAGFNPKPPDKSNHPTSSPPPTAAHLFPDYDPAALDPAEEKAANVIIQRLLEGGTREELRWLFTTCGQTRVTEWVRKGGYRGLSPQAFGYWRLILRIEDFLKPPWTGQKMDSSRRRDSIWWGR